MIASGIDSRTKEGLFWSTGLKIIFEVFRFGISIVIARILDPLDFGIMAIGAMVIYFSNSMSDFGFCNALVQRKEVHAVHINSVFTLNFGISLALTAAILLLATPLSRFFNSPQCAKVLMLMSAMFIVRTFYDISSALLRREVRFKFVAKIYFLQSTAQSLLALAMALIGLRYWSLVWSNLVALLLVTIILVNRADWRPRLIYNHRAMRPFYEFGFWNFIRAQLYFVNNYIPQFFIGRSLGPTSLGFFEKAYSITSIPLNSLMQPINTVLFSTFSRLQEDTTELVDWFQKLLIIQSVLIVPVLGGAVVRCSSFRACAAGGKVERIGHTAPNPVCSRSIQFLLRGDCLSQCGRRGISQPHGQNGFWLGVHGRSLLLHGALGNQRHCPHIYADMHHLVPAWTGTCAKTPRHHAFVTRRESCSLLAQQRAYGWRCAGTGTLRLSGEEPDEPCCSFIKWHGYLRRSADLFEPDKRKGADVSIQQPETLYTKHWAPDRNLKNRLIYNLPEPFCPL